MPKISVLTVTYNSAARLRPTLEALAAQEFDDYEAVVVDNASRDDSLEIAREFAGDRLRVVANDSNRGFAGGNNDAARLTSGEIVFLLNPDAILPPDGLAEIARAFDATPEMGVLGAKLVDVHDGETLQACGGEMGVSAHCRSHGRGEKDTGQFSEPREVEYVAGAAMGIRRSVWDALGGFDEAFNPAYYEDADLCARCRRLGHAVMYWPLRVLHHENVSVELASWAFLEMHHGNRLRYLAKHTPLWRLPLITLPAEIRWLCSWHSQRCRKITLRRFWNVFVPTLWRRVTGGN